MTTTASLPDPPARAGARPMILVTGATGTTGGEVVRALRRHGGVQLRLAMRAEAPVDVGPDEAVSLDFQRPSTFGPALHGVTGVFLLRPPALVRPVRDFQPFIAAMTEAGVERVVFLSVRGAGRIPILPHRGIEHLIEASGLTFTHLRPNDFMQNLLTVHRDDIQLRGEIRAPAGQGRASWVDVRDVAEVAALALLKDGHRGRAYTLTGPEALDFNAAAMLLSNRIGHPVVYRPLSLAAFLGEALRQPRGGRALRLVMAGLYTVQRLNLAAAVDLTLERLLGRRPRDLAAFIEDNADAWRRP